MTTIKGRKDEHLDIVLSGAAGPKAGPSGFDQVAFEHEACPDLDADAIDLSTTFLGWRLRAPLLISSMTGGPARASSINAALAEAAQEVGIAFAVGSQRIAIETGEDAGIGRTLRRRAPDVPLLANIGAAQVALWANPAKALRAVEMIGADALIVHFNPLQEAVQPGGDTRWSGVMRALEDLARQSPVPLVAKEVGCGISAATARRLADIGFAAIDVAGAGGTSWAAVEAERAETRFQREVAAPFRDWGIPTPQAIAEVRAALPDHGVIASGGIRHGLDVALAIRLGADLVGQAAGLLPAAMEGPPAVVTRLRTIIAQLRVACFCTGSRSLHDLRQARLRQAPC